MEPNTLLINFLALIALLLVLVIGEEWEQMEENESELHASDRYAVADKIKEEMDNYYNRI